MKKLYMFLVTALMFVFITNISAQTFVDDFTGLTTGVLAGQNGWVKGGTGPDASVSNVTPLSYVGYNGGGLEYVTMGIPTGTTSRVYKTFPSPITNYNSSTFYFSFLLRISDASDNSTTKNYFLSLGVSGTSTSYGAKLFTNLNGSGYNIGLSKTSNTAVYGNSVLSFNTTYLVIVRYDFHLAGTTAPEKYDDEAYLWINPSLGSEPSIMNAEVTVPAAGTDTDFDGYGVLTDVGNFIWHNRGLGNPKGDFDGVRVGHGTTSAEAWVDLAAEAVVSPYLLSENFESITNSGDPIAGWTFSNAQTWNLAGYGHNSDKYAGWDETHNADHWITSPMVKDPGTLSFWLAAYNDEANLQVKVQVSTNGTDWTDKATFTSKGAGGDFGLDFVEETVPIQLTGDYYIRWTTANYVSGGFYIDDVLLDNVVPVELTSFAASVNGNSVSLKWATATETNNSGFEVERKSSSTGWQKIAFVQGNGTTTQPKSYSYSDRNLADGKYSYRLKQIDLDGTFDYSKVVEVNINSNTVNQFELAQNYPNPFNPTTAIKFNLPEGGNVKLSVYNLLGQEVATLVNGFKEAGSHTVNFDASNLNSGIYLYKIQANGFTQTRKMTLIK